jgi:ankyrin repeat protein
VLRTKAARTIKVGRKPKSSTTAVEIPELAAQKKKELDKKRAKTPTPVTRSRAITIQKPKKPRVSARVPLYLLTESDEMVGGHVLRPGMFDNPAPSRIRAYEPNDLAYYMLSTKNGRYLHVDRIWPVLVNETSALRREETWGGWSFKLVELGPPMLLSSPATWQQLLDAGMMRKPKRKSQPSLLHWAAIQGHVDVLRTLLDGGAMPVASEDVVMAAAAFGKRATTKLLVERGFDGAQAVVTMRTSKNELALTILHELGFV